MAHVHTQSDNSVVHTLVEILVAPFKFLWNFLVGIAEANVRVKEINYLSSLTDEGLAKKGLKRNDIIQHVFRDSSPV